MVECGLHRLQGAPLPGAGPERAVAQRVQGPLQRDAGQLGGLAQLLADVLAVHRLIAPAAGEDRLLGLAGQTSGLGVDQNRQPDRRGQRPLPLLAALAAVAVKAALQVEVAPAQVQDLAATPAGEQVGQDQGAQAQACRRIDRNRRQQPRRLIGAQAAGPGEGSRQWDRRGTAIVFKKRAVDLL
jgi:hypothetical protein